jgi:glycosyltransferase involved in cell wall biosynthesis
LLAPRGDAPALAARLRELVARGGDGRAAMGAAGRALCAARYGWPAIADRLEAMYEAAIARARRRAGVF